MDRKDVLALSWVATRAVKDQGRTAKCLGTVDLLSKLALGEFAFLDDLDCVLTDVTRATGIRLNLHKIRLGLSSELTPYYLARLPDGLTARLC